MQAHNDMQIEMSQILWLKNRLSLTDTHKELAWLLQQVIPLAGYFGREK